MSLTNVQTDWDVRQIRWQDGFRSEFCGFAFSSPRGCPSKPSCFAVTNPFRDMLHQLVKWFCVERVFSTDYGVLLTLRRIVNAVHNMSASIHRGVVLQALERNVDSGGQ